MKPAVGRREAPGFRLVIYAILIVGVLPVLLPTYWMVLASLKSRERISVSPPDWLPLNVRDSIFIAEQRVPVVIFDDATVSQTGVPRVKMKHDAAVRLPRGGLERVEDAVHYAEIDGVRRRVEPLEPFQGGQVRVALPGTRAHAAVPTDEIETGRIETNYWMVLGAELPVRVHGRLLAGDPPVAQIRLVEDTGAIRVAPEKFEPGEPGTVAWDGRRLAARQISGLSPAGFLTIELIKPADGIEVPIAELRTQVRRRHVATIDGQGREVKPLRQTDSGTTLVEIVGQPREVLLPAGALESRTDVDYFAEILGQRRRVVPQVSKVPGDAAAEVPVFVPGPIAVTADRIHTAQEIEPRWSNYAAAWAEQNFDLYIVNTLFIAALVVFGTIMSCGLVGYGFARFEFRGRDPLFMVLLATMMVPPQVTAIPTFVLFVKFGWIDTYLPLIVPHFLSFSAFFVFLFRQFMLTIPNELEDAARIDGCGPLATWWLVIMPISKPIIITVAVFSFTYVWNDFLMPLLYINSDEKQTVALGLQSFKSAFQGAEPQLIMAASAMMMIPTIVLFFLAQRAFMRGVVVSGVKG